MKGAVGILGYQGGSDLHISALRSLGIESVKIHYWDNFENLSGLILPGGESSVQYRYCTQYGLIDKIKNFAKTSKPILGTCAGAILLSKFSSEKVNGFSLIDIDIERNAYGKQIASAVEQSDSGNEIVFIRAPSIIRIGSDVRVLDTYESKPIFVRQNNIFSATFHPEVGSINDGNILMQIFGK